MTSSELAQHPKVEGAIDRLADRIRGNGGIAIPRPAMEEFLATLLTVLRESEGPVLDFADARSEAIARSAAGYDTEAHAYDVALEAQAATQVAALRARVAGLEARIKKLETFIEAEFTLTRWAAFVDGELYQTLYKTEEEARGHAYGFRSCTDPNLSASVEYKRVYIVEAP